MKTYFGIYISLYFGFLLMFQVMKNPNVRWIFSKGF